MPIREVDEENFNAEIVDAFEKKHLLILKFGSEYCASCHALECELETINEEVEEVSILIIDTTESPELAEAYDVFELPTMVIYKDVETKIYHKVGVILAEDIHIIIKES